MLELPSMYQCSGRGLDCAFLTASGPGSTAAMILESNVPLEKTDLFLGAALQVFGSTFDILSWPSICSCVDLAPVA